MPTTRSGVPSEFAPKEIDEFVALVLAGGEVTPNGLRARVAQAAQLAFLREGGSLIGVGGLKRPSSHHRAEVAEGSSIALPAGDFPLELGWVFILPGSRRKGLSITLCRPLVSAAKGQGIFATSQTDNLGMHRTLVKLDFLRIGDEWPSQQRSGSLALFTKNAA